MFNSKYKKINKLINSDDSEIKISIILPTHVQSDGNAREKDRIRIRNAFRKLRNSLTLDKELEQRLKQAESKMMSDKFLKSLSKGMAVYLSSETFECFNLDIETTDIVHHGDQFIVSPLIIERSVGSAMYVLHVSLKEPQLYIHDKTGLTPINEIHLPNSLKEGMQIDEYIKDKQHHVSGKGGGAVHHGHGGASNKQDDIEVYYERVANALDQYFAGKRIPLLLIGVEERIAQLRNNMEYKYISDKSVVGNYQDLNEQQLHDQMSSVINEIFIEELSKNNQIVKKKADEFVLNDADEIEQATKIGQVKNLYVPIMRLTRDSVRPGRVKEALIDAASFNLAKLEQLVRDVVSQGGSIKPLAAASVGNGDKYIATLRYKIKG